MKPTVSKWLGIFAAVIALELLVVGITFLLAASWHLKLPEAIDLGQLVVALVLIPPAIVAFWQARDALQQSAARPALRLAFLGEDGLLHDAYVMRIPRQGGNANRVTFAVENTGSAVAVWWQAEFDIPVPLMRLLRSGNGKVNVMPRHVPFVSMDTVGDAERRVFQSTGTVGLFPGPPVQLASLEAEIAQDSIQDLDQEFQIKYRLLTDRTEPTTGALPLRLVTMGAA